MNEPSKQTRRLKQILGVVLLMVAALCLFPASELPPEPEMLAERSSPIAGQPIDGPVAAGDQPFRPKQLPPGATKEELAKSAPAPVAVEGYRSVTLDALSSFSYELDKKGGPAILPDGNLSRIPSRIQQYDEADVAISGFAVPITFEDERVRDFVLVKNQMLCCFGQVPKMNEWILVRMAEPISPTAEMPVTVLGQLLVGEIMEDGRVLGLYFMDGHQVKVMD